MLARHTTATESSPRWHREQAAARLRLLARALTLVWAAFCAYAIASDVLDPQASPNLSSVEQASMIGVSLLLLAALVAISWRWERMGGVLLVVVGAFPLLATVLLFARGVLPLLALLLDGFLLGIVPLTAGSLFLLHAHGQEDRWPRP